MAQFQNKEKKKAKILGQNNQSN